MYSIATAFVTVLALGLTVVSAKELKYTLAPNFFDDKPNGQQLGPCHGGVVIDHTGNIYVATDTERGLLVYSPEGKFLRSCGPRDLHGLELRKEKGGEFIYGTRPGHHDAFKLKLNGEQVWSIEYPKESGIYTNANQFKPTAITVVPDGSIFICDGYGMNYVHKFDKNRKYIKSFGGPGDKEGTFRTCHGIACDTRHGKPLLLICNRNAEPSRLEYWDLDGNFVKTIRKDLRMPATVQMHGEYAIIAELQGRATILDKDNNIVAQVGDNPNEKHRANFGLSPEQWVVGILNAPHGAAMDKDGNLIVSEWSKFGRLSKYTLDKRSAAK